MSTPRHHGLTAYACFGKWGGIHYGKTLGGVRALTLGWVSFGLMPMDLERWMVWMVQDRTATATRHHHFRAAAAKALQNLRLVSGAGPRSYAGKARAALDAAMPPERRRR